MNRPPFGNEKTAIAGGHRCAHNPGRIVLDDIPFSRPLKKALAADRRP